MITLLFQPDWFRRFSWLYCRGEKDAQFCSYQRKCIKTYETWVEHGEKNFQHLWKKTCSKTILNKIWRNTTSKASKFELMMNLSQNIIFTICIKINCMVFTITTAYYYHHCCHFPPYCWYWFHGYYLTKTVFKFFTYLNISLLLFLSVVSFLLLLLLH